MPNYSVNIPIAGFINVEVEAANKAEAKEKAMACSWRATFDGEKDGVELIELEAYEHLVQDRVCYVSVTHVEIDEVDR